MFFGLFGECVVCVFNCGVCDVNVFYNMGEGGIFIYYCEGGDLMLQFGIGYFGVCIEDGCFDFDCFVELCDGCEQVCVIEIKLLQGVKFGKGGILLGFKVIVEIVVVCGIFIGKSCYLFNVYCEFDMVDEMIDFIECIVDVMGLLIGIKSVIGECLFWIEFVQCMKVCGEGLDFIFVDGGEGGIGLVLMIFVDYVLLFFKVGFKCVYMCFFDEGMVDCVVWIGSGKFGFLD